MLIKNYKVLKNIWVLVSTKTEGDYHLLLDMEPLEIDKYELPNEFLDYLSKVLGENYFSDIYQILSKGYTLYIEWDKKFSDDIEKIQVTSELGQTDNPKTLKLLQNELTDIFQDSGKPEWLSGPEIIGESVELSEKYKSKKDVPSSLTNLSLTQANYWADVYDAVLGKQGKETKAAKSKSAKIAWKQTKKKYDLKEEVNSNQISIENYLQVGDISLGDIERKTSNFLDDATMKYFGTSWNSSFVYTPKSNGLTFVILNNRKAPAGKRFSVYLLYIKDLEEVYFPKYGTQHIESFKNSDEAVKAVENYSVDNVLK